MLVVWLHNVHTVYVYMIMHHLDEESLMIHPCMCSDFSANYCMYKL